MPLSFFMVKDTPGLSGSLQRILYLAGPPSSSSSVFFVLLRPYVRMESVPKFIYSSTGNNLFIRPKCLKACGTGAPEQLTTPHTFLADRNAILSSAFNRPLGYCPKLAHGAYPRPPFPRCILSIIPIRKGMLLEGPLHLLLGYPFHGWT